MPHTLQADLFDKIWLILSCSVDLLEEHLVAAMVKVILEHQNKQATIQGVHLLDLIFCYNPRERA